MTRRDRAWRAAGAALFAAACAIGVINRLDGGSAGLPGFGLAVLGLVLLVQGKRVPAAMRVERSPHRTLARAIRQRRARRAHDGDN